MRSGGSRGRGKAGDAGEKGGVKNEVQEREKDKVREGEALLCVSNSTLPLPIY